MALRVRLTLLYIGLLGPALLVFSLVVYLIASRRIYRDVDDSLNVRAQSIAAVLQPLDTPLTASVIADNSAALDSQASAGTVFRITDPTGAVLYQSSPTSGVLPPSRRAPVGEHMMFSTTVQKRHTRVLYDPVIGTDGTVYGRVETAVPLNQSDDAVEELRYVLIIGGIAVLLLTSVPAYLVAGRAVRPIRQVAALARDIERTADFSKRLPQATGGSETVQLVATFNAMIDRVERMLVTQREFLADSSHELRRPLTVLRTYIDLLTDPALPAEEREACYEEMRTEAEAMSRLISDLLLLSREGSQTIRRTRVNYTKLCQQAMERLRSQDEKHVLRAETAPNIHVQGDPERLGQMLWNLLENATQYTPEGGRVELRLQRNDGMAHVEVSDTGMGSPPDEAEHVFERFYRGQDARVTRGAGTGLGLAIVRHVAEGHGGHVQVRSRPGEGTTFTVDLPAASDGDAS